MVGRLLIVVDTSYWLELFQIPNHSNSQAGIEVKKRFQQAAQNKASFFWTLPSVYEVANHIAHVVDGRKREELAEKFYKKIKDSSAITITPACALEDFSSFLEKFKSEYVKQRIGLVDASIIVKADELKNKNNQVHIWTLDNALKSREPDQESDPFCGFK